MIFTNCSEWAHDVIVASLSINTEFAVFCKQLCTKRKQLLLSCYSFSKLKILRVPWWRVDEYWRDTSIGDCADKLPGNSEIEQNKFAICNRQTLDRTITSCLNKIGLFIYVISFSYKLITKKTLNSAPWCYRLTTSMRIERRMMPISLHKLLLLFLHYRKNIKRCFETELWPIFRRLTWRV